MSAAANITETSSDLVATLDYTNSVAALLGDGLVAFDADFRCIYWSRRMAEMFGLAAGEVIGQPLGEFFPLLGDNRHASEALAGKRTASTNRTYSIPETGKQGSLDAYYFPVLATSGTILCGAALIRDITESKRAEQQRQETELRFRNMADVAPVLLWMADTDGLCTFFNQTWLDFTGRTLEQEWGVGWAEGVHFEDFQRCMDTYVAGFNKRRRFEMEYRLRRQDGEYRWILDRGTPRFTPEGDFAGYIGSCVDITDQKRVETDLRRAVREHDEFLSIAAHELRTPLTSLQLQVDNLGLVVDRASLEEATRDRLKKCSTSATRQVRRMVTLVEQLLDVSRLTIGTLALSIEQTNLSALVTEVVERFADLARTTNTDLLVVKPEVAFGLFDRARLDQVLSNLVANALKYAPGKPIDITLEVHELKVVISIKDHGPGIAPHDQERIFERFERAVSARNYGGFGLGLWIARQIVDAHAGTVRVDSRLGDGARFTVELPRSAS